VGRIFIELKEEFKYKFGNAREVAAYSYKLNQIKINLKYIESVDHLYEVITHEFLHKVLTNFSIPITREHKLIRKIQWADYNI